MVNLRKALLLFSGGQDSATCLAWACENYDLIETVGFEYGQRHDVEMTCRLDVLKHMKARFPRWASKIGKDHIIDLSALGAISETSLTRESEIEMGEAGLPNTFVPGRNLIFLNFAAAVGYRRGISTLVGGMCEADFSGYPDCRTDTLKAVMTSISLGMDREFKLETPLMHLSKAGAWTLAESLGGSALVQLILSKTHTCYVGERGAKHPWGYGCGDCPACEIRARGWREFENAK